MMDRGAFWSAFEESVREYEERTLTDWMDEGYSENDDEIWGDKSDEYERV